MNFENVSALQKIAGEKNAISTESGDRLINMDKTATELLCAAVLIFQKVYGNETEENAKRILGKEVNRIWDEYDCDFDGLDPVETE